MKARRQPARAGNWPRPWFLALAGSIALLGQMPAHRVAAAITAACAGQCRLAEVSGPWWAGRGELFVQAPAGKAWLALGDFTWQAAPAGGIAEARLGRGRILLRTLDELSLDGIALPAELLLAQPRLALPTGHWQGRLEFSQTLLRRAGGKLGESHGEVRWQGAASSLLAGYPLGDYQAHWQWQQDAQIKARIAGGRSGSIAVQAEITPLAGVDREHRLRGNIALDGDARTELGRYLRLVSPAAGDNAGDYPIDWPLAIRPGQ